MPKKQMYLGLGAMCLFAVCLTTVSADHHESDAKYSIKEVMQKAHKGGLLKKVAGGDASADEKMKLLDYYLSLVENTPPKGDMESWQTLAGKAVLAAAKVAVGRDGAEAELRAATKCADCHKKHKGN